MSGPEENEDPFLAELLDEVLADHSDLPAAVVEEMRDLLELMAKTHPTALAIVNRARPRKAPQRSGEEEIPGAPPRAVVDDDRREGTDG